MRKTRGKWELWRVVKGLLSDFTTICDRRIRQTIYNRCAKICIFLIGIITARKRSLRRLCFHRCLSVHRGRCLHPPNGTRGRHPQEQTPPGPEADTPPAVHAWRYGQQAAGTHPTRMHTCNINVFISDLPFKTACDWCRMNVLRKCCLN